MAERKKFHSIDSLFTFLLLLAFLLFSLLLAGTGSMIYQRGADSLNQNYTSRTAIAYITEKLRQHDSLNDVVLTDVEGVPALALRQTLEGESFFTYIYYCDGALRELFTRASTSPALSMGAPITELSSCTFVREESFLASSGEMLRIQAADETGAVQSVLVHLTCSQEE